MTANGPGGTDYDTDKGDFVCDSFQIIISESFNFYYKTLGYTFNFDEDCAAQTIAATNDAFVCTAGTSLPLKTTKEVKFDGCKIVADSDEAAALMGEASLVNGAISFKPAKDFNGKVAIETSAVSTNPQINADPIPVTININVNPVDDPPEVVFNDAITVVEGETVTFSITFSDIDNVWSDYYDEAAGVNKIKVYGGKTEVPGKWTAVSEGVYSFTADDVLPYETVSHKNAKNTLDSTVTVVFDNKKDAAFSQAATLIDVDRVVTTSDAPSAVISPENPQAGDTLSIAIAADSASDEDAEDVIQYKVVWINNSGAETEESPVLEKGQIWSARITPFTVVYGEEKAAASFDSDNSVTVANTAPVLAADKNNVFILKPEVGTAEPEVFTFTITDPDNEELRVVVSSNDSAKGSISAPDFKDNRTFTLTYTVADGAPEFSDDQADTFTVKVSDGNDDSNEIQIKVSYRQDEAPIITKVAGVEGTASEANDKGKTNVLNFSISAQDSPNGNPSGVKSVEWTLSLVSGKTDTTDVTKYLPVAKQSFKASEGAAAATASAQVVLDYDLVSGADRDASVTLQLDVVVKDGKGLASSEKWTFVVKDTDRAPTAPTALNPSKQTLSYGDTELTLDAAGATDPDGDPIKYEYRFYLNGNAMTKDYSESGVLPPVTLVKNNQVKGEARAYSTPAYGTTKKYGDVKSQLFTVINTSPEAIFLDNITVDEYVKALGDSKKATCRIPINQLVMFTDVDNDTLEYDVKLIDTASNYISSAKIDKEVLVLTLKPGANTSNCEFPPALMLIAYDEGKDGFSSASQYVTITINQINDAPVISGLPYGEPALYPMDQVMNGIGGSFTAKTGSDDALAFDEAAQKIKNVSFTASDSSIVVTPGKFETKNGVANIDYTITLADTSNFQAGVPITIYVTVEDDGTPSASAEDSFQIIIGGSWYPEYTSATDEDADGILIVAKNSKGKEVASFICTNRDWSGCYVMNDKAYYEAGFSGFKPGTYYFDEYLWSVSKGAGKNTRKNFEVVVSDYGIPGSPDFYYDSYFNAGTLYVRCSLAQGFAYLVRNESGKVICEGNTIFQPNEYGKIESEGILALNLPAGTYTVSCMGFNPAHEGPIATQTIYIYDNDYEPTIVGEFSPANNAVLNAPSDKLTVFFTWPTYSAATQYTMLIFDANGNVVETETTQDPFDEVTLPAGNYTWRVIAKNGNDIELSSYDYQAFTIINTTNKAVTPVSAVVSDDDTIGQGLVLAAMELTENKSYAMEIVWYDNVSASWIWDTYTATAASTPSVYAGNVLYLSFPELVVRSGDYVLCRPAGSNDDFSTFQILNYHVEK